LGPGQGAWLAGWLVRWRVEGDAQADLDVPAGDLDLFDDES
jgi:hypothetical protein